MMGDLEPSLVTCDGVVGAGAGSTAHMHRGEPCSIADVSRRMAFDFLLHTIRHVFDVDPTRAKSHTSMHIAERMGHGVVGGNAPPPRIAHARVLSLVTSLLPASAASRLKLHLASASGACADWDLDSFVEVMMVTWFDLHHDRMADFMDAHSLCASESGNVTFQEFANAVRARYPDVPEARISDIFGEAVGKGEWVHGVKRTAFVWSMLVLYSTSEQRTL